MTQIYVLHQPWPTKAIAPISPVDPPEATALDEVPHGRLAGVARGIKEPEPPSNLEG